MRTPPLIAAFCTVLLVSPAVAESPKTRVELKTDYFSPGLTLAESKHPVHGVRIVVETNAKGEGKGKLTLLLDPANYDEYGDFVTGRETDDVDRKRTKPYIPPIELDCSTEFVKAGSIGRVNQSPIKRSIFRVTGPKISSPLYIATEGPGLIGGRLLVHGSDQRVEHVFPLMEIKPGKEGPP